MITECQNIIVGQLDNSSSSSCDVNVYVLTVKLSAWNFLVVLCTAYLEIKFNLHSEVEWLQNVHYVSPVHVSATEKRWKLLFNPCLTLISCVTFLIFDMLCTRSFRFQLHWNVMYTILSLSIALEINMTNLEFAKLSRNSLAWIRS